MSAVCQNDHEHLPFQVTMIDGPWAFNTVAEATQVHSPKKVASLVKRLLETKDRAFVPRPLPRIQTLAAQHRQHKKRDQLQSLSKGVNEGDLSTRKVDQRSDPQWVHRKLPTERQSRQKEQEDGWLD